MKLADLLAPDRVLLDVPGPTVRDAAGPLVRAVIASGRSTDPATLEALLADSLPREAVTVGQQAFLLHFRTDAVTAITAALARSAIPVHREHDPSKDSRLVLLLLAPPRQAAHALRALSAFARALADETLVARLHSAADPASVMALPGLDHDIPADLAVRDVMTLRPVTVQLETTVGQALDLMLRHDQPALPVVAESGDVLGLISYGEIMQHLVPSFAKRLSGGTRRGERSDPRDLPVRSAMDRTVLCLTDDQRLADAAAMLVSKRLERVPVVRDGRLVGMLTREGIVRRLFS